MRNSLYARRLRAAIEAAGLKPEEGINGVSAKGIAQALAGLLHFGSHSRARLAIVLPGFSNEAQEEYQERGSEPLPDELTAALVAMLKLDAEGLGDGRYRAGSEAAAKAVHLLERLNIVEVPDDEAYGRAALPSFVWIAGEVASGEGT